MTISGHVLRGHWAKSNEVPSRGMHYYYTVDHYRVIQFVDSLGEGVIFPSHPSLFCPLSSAVCCCFLQFVFECPHLYWARKVFNFDPCKLFMISKHDLLKRLWAFVHSHLIPPLVCSLGAQQTSFRICSTDLCVYGRMGENINHVKGPILDDIEVTDRAWWCEFLLFYCKLCS